MYRIVIAGGPNTGKSTWASILSVTTPGLYYCTDVLKHLPWSESGEAAYEELVANRGGVFEGVLAARALRYWVRSGSTERPCETVVWLTKPVPGTEETDAQRRCRLGVNTIMKEIVFALEKAGVDVFEA
jgi:adenylate kinase family enzyme